MEIEKHLTLITDEISQDFEKVLYDAEEFNIKNVEVRGVWGKNIALITNDDLKNMKILLSKKNMGISMVSGPFGKCFLPSSKLAKPDSKSLSRDPEFNLGLFDRLVEICQILGTKNMRIFNFFLPGKKYTNEQWNEMKELLLPYIEKAEQQKITLMLENEHVSFADTVENTIKLFDEIDSPALKLNLDPGNYYSAKSGIKPEDYEYFYKNDLVGYMHVKDPKFRLPLIGSFFNVVGEGKIDYKALFEQAKDYGYDSYFSLETHTLKKKREISLKSLMYMRELINQL